MRSPPWFKASPPGTSSSLSTPFQSTSLQVYLPPVPLECAVSGCLAHTSWHSPTKPSLSSHSCWWRSTPELCFSSLLCGTSLCVIRNRKNSSFLHFQADTMVSTTYQLFQDHWHALLQKKVTSCLPSSIKFNLLVLLQQYSCAETTCACMQSAPLAKGWSKTYLNS